MTANPAHITRADIHKQVEAFYTRIRSHDVLGPIFNARIGTDDAQWAPHLEKIEAFWAGVFLGERQYQGNPMQAHRDLPSIERWHFKIWLELFENTARELFPKDKAEAFDRAARRIGRSLQIGALRKGDIPILRAF